MKRWKKLPKNTKRNWAHVVVARAGPGAKSFVKQKKKEEKVEEFEKIRRKHVYRKKSRSDEESNSRPQTPMSNYLAADFVGRDIKTHHCNQQVVKCLFLPRYKGSQKD